MYVLRELSPSPHGCKTWVHIIVLCGTYAIESYGYRFAGRLIISTDAGQEREHILLGRSSRKNVKTNLVMHRERTFENCYTCSSPNMNDQISRANRPVRHAFCTFSPRQIMDHQKTQTQPLVPLIGTDQPLVPDYRCTSAFL